MAGPTLMLKMKPIYLNVALAVPLRRTFHYLPPKGQMAEECQVGCRVKVPFGRQTLVGFVIGHAQESDFADKIKPALELIDRQAILSAKMFELCVWASEYYHHALGEVLHGAIPVLLRQGRDSDARTKKLESVHDDPELIIKDLRQAPRQRALLQALIPDGLTKEALSRLDYSAATIKALIDRGAAHWQEFRLEAPEKPPQSFGTPLNLSDEQSQALAAIDHSGTHLLFGITGSGKTEVYLQAIEKVVRIGKQALMLVPEIGLTPQTIARFEQRFPGQVIAMHSAMTNLERLGAWRRAHSGSAAVIVGTRSAIYSPMPNPGLIVVDEEHDASFKQQEGFRYSARDLAVKRGQLERIPVLLGSATPSLETFANAKSGRYKRLNLTRRANDASFAKYKIIGTEHQQLDEGFSPQLVKMMRQHLSEGNQVLVFLNRRGFAPVLHCRQCRWLSNCPRCDGRMTFHLTTKMLVCHHCDSQQRSPKSCPDCGSNELVPLGLGTQRLESGLQKIFPDEKIVRIDRDSTRKKNELENKLEEVGKGQRGILLGTQLLAKGHHFPDVTLVAVVDLDSGLFSSDFHAVERMGQLLLQVGGRAGREKKSGVVAIQTLYPEQPMLKLLVEKGYEAFCDELLVDRQTSELPPYNYQAIVRAEAAQAGTALNFLESLSRTSQFPHAELLGPIPAPMEKRAGKFRAQLLASSSSRGQLHQLLKHIVNEAEQSIGKQQVRWSIDVDPYDLF